MRAFLSSCLLMASLGAAAEEQPVIGRLFAPAGAGSSSMTAANRLRVDGAVARSTGKNTVWINGQAHTETGGGARTGLSQVPAVRLEGRHVLRVGETLDLENGRRLGLLPEDALAKGR